MQMKSFWTAVASGVMVGAICTALLAVPQIRDLEEDVGLRWLFKLRGPIKPPEQIVMVAMSHQAAANIFLPRDPEKFHRCQDLIVGPAPSTHMSLPSMPSRWPRCLHAQLVKKLADAGAGLIAFDVLFRQRPPQPGASGDLYAWQDEALASAFTAADRVVIAQKLEFIDGRETLAELSPAIAKAALGSAPFPIIAAHDRRVARFMAFKESGRVTPTLPIIAMQAYSLSAYPRLAEFLARQTDDAGVLLPSTAEALRASGELQATCLLIRQLLHNNPVLAQRGLAEFSRDDTQPANPEAGEQVRTLASMYAGNGTRLLNFYGPAGTIPEISYDQVLASTPDSLGSLLKGRAVFVGYAETAQLEEVEHFATAFSTSGGLDLSGVEIAATAFSNLLHDNSIRELPLPYWLVLVFLSGLLSTLICGCLTNRLALVIMAVALGAYGGTSLYVFSSHALWIPVVVPMFVAAPAGMLSAFAWKYWTTRRQREQLRRAFTYFVPKELVDALEQNAAQIGGAKESLECACVATDAANFTPLAETMTPEQLADFLHLYFETLFGRVADHGGFVSDVVGDAMLAIWPYRSADTHSQLLHALLEMRDAAQQFNERLAGNRLLTRFGVDWGRVTLTTVGAHAHYEYRAVGDTVNTAARIQELNKKLGTRILLSQPAIGDVGKDFLLRDLGQFLLRGKDLAVHVYELMNTKPNATREQTDLCARFAQGIDALNCGDQSVALARLRELHAEFPGDGPTAFYLRALASGLTLSHGALRVD
jgi:adenylate cyclase